MPKSVGDCVLVVAFMFGFSQVFVDWFFLFLGNLWKTADLLTQMLAETAVLPVQPLI